MHFLNAQEFTLIIALVFVFSSCSDPKSSESKYQDSTQNENTGSNDPALTTLPDVLKGIPKGIEVWNEPDTFRAVKWEKDTNKFIWKHETYLFTDVADLIITEFGTYNYRDGEWVLGNLNKKIYGPEELEKWYVQYDKGMVKWDHPVLGLIKKNTVYFDPANYSIKNDSLVLRKGLWYYIGVDSAGNKYMGYKRYVALPEMLK